MKEGDKTVLDSLYAYYRDEFITWSGAMYKLSEDNAADVFQDAVITFYSNVKSGKLTELTSSIKTYLFAIGKNLSLKKIKKEKRMVLDDEVLEFNSSVEYQELSFEYTERQKTLAQIVEKLGDPCKSILKLFYFENFTMDSIAERLDYKNENVAKTQKLRCLQKLKSMFENRAINKDDL
ncbi:sigma-70 family RNA polymerase sigma factor [Fulvivirga aurantia]|uniref:RNA polymerase sigma factor n=1 Tax=Fulvivirga aurantia TaxID=2529383 RepID=UPI0031B5DA76